MKPLYGGGDEKRPGDVPQRPGLPAEPYRSPYRRDYARLIHSAAFRRLQGKTQVFPGWESDFFRNRLTHSLEVAQIAKSLAIRINYEHEYFRENPIDLDIVETVALAHDLGHPPFGHNGEAALDACMKHFGGFEGNAQTLRIVGRLEKKEPIDDRVAVDEDGTDRRLGLNWTYRSLAGVLKYDRKIKVVRKNNSDLMKGYYSSEDSLVREIKKHVLGDGKHMQMKTVECALMDIADDIAYSTYDLEDTFKAGFLEPLYLLTLSRSEQALLERVASKVSLGIGESVSVRQVVDVIDGIFGGVVFGEAQHKRVDEPMALADLALTSRRTARNGYLRTGFTANLVSVAISGVSVVLNEEYPALSSVVMEKETHLAVEVLKNLTFELTIMSPMLRVSENRGFEIVTGIFRRLAQDEGSNLLPYDFHLLYERANGDEATEKRVICDFIAGMTDRYAAEFYGRLYSEEPQSIFKPF